LNLLSGSFHTGAQKRHIEGMLHDLGKAFDQVWRERDAARPGIFSGVRLVVRGALLRPCWRHHGANLLIDGGSYPGTF
jgi:3-oxoacyl-[acyl-carrier protein] reductase